MGPLGVKKVLCVLNFLSLAYRSDNQKTLRWVVKKNIKTIKPKLYQFS
jgi:hypothetical protein